MSFRENIKGAQVSSRSTGRGWGRIGRLSLVALASALKSGRLFVETPDGETLVFPAPAAGPSARFTLHRWRPLWRLLIGGDLGFAESYMDGEWSSPDLAALIELAGHNQNELSPSIRGKLPQRLLNRLHHFTRRNTKRGSRRNIAQHYDLGNAFYEQWLDRSMSYSSALYSAPGMTLEAAQIAKNQRIVELLELQGGEKILEIGCGWGALAERMLADNDSHVTGLTLSREQLSAATRRVAAAGAAERADLRLQDYRDVAGKFDRIVSIEMIEAVGEKHWPQYFEVLNRRLAEGGTAVLQVITIDDAHFAGYRSNPDFIQRYIFPGGMLPSPSRLRRHIAEAGLVLDREETFGPSYERTLGEWQRRFQAAWPALAALGYTPRFKRMWEYYLAYCQGGFRTGVIDVGLYRLRKPAGGPQAAAA